MEVGIVPSMILSPKDKESVIVLAKILLPRVYENMSMQDMRNLTAERSTLNTYLRGETIEVSSHSIGFLLEGFIKSHSLVEELITSPAVLWPAQGNSSFLSQEDSGYKSTSFLHQGTSYYVETRARVLLIDMAPIQADNTLMRRKSSVLLHDQSSRSLIPREHAGLLSWPENQYKSHQHLPDGQEIDDNQNLSAKAMQLSIYGSMDPSYYVLKEDESPCIFGPIDKQRWSYACAKQLIERLVYAEGAENGLEFTIVRPFNWIGPRMDFIPGIDGPSEGVPRVLACFSNNLLRREPLKLVDGGESQRTFIYIKDAIEAVLLMIENPGRANGHIFNVGNPNNEVTVRQLAEMMTKVYSKVSGESEIETPTIDVSSKEFYGEGYDDSDKRIPDMTIINKQLGWNPKTSLWDLLESTLTYQHRTYAEAIKQATSKPIAS